MNNETRMIFIEAVKQIKSEGWNMDHSNTDDEVIKRMKSLQRMKNKAAKLWRDDILTLKYTATHTSDKLATGYRQ